MHKEKLHQLQLEQILHDQNYHADILCLPVQRRANHMALHFAKYAGKFTIAKHNRDRDFLSKSLIDTFVICLASSNMFNIEIAQLEVFDEVKTKTFSNLGTEIYSFAEIINDDIYSFTADYVTIYSGEMAKAIESLDHMEPYPFRETFEKCLESIIGIVFVSSSFLKLDLISETKKRLQSVEEKSIFYSDLSTGQLQKLKNSSK